MSNLFKKCKSDVKGFTLAELLIVVAIISILALVAIPVFNSKLEYTREETDIANIRSAKAAAIASYLSDTDPAGSHISKDGTVMYFDSISGCLTLDVPAEAYGKGTAVNGGCEAYGLFVNSDSEEDNSFYQATTDVEDCVIKVTVYTSGKIEMEWVNPGEA